MDECMMDDCMTGVWDGWMDGLGRMAIWDLGFGIWDLGFGIGMRDTGLWQVRGTGPWEIVHAMDLLFSSCIGDYGVVR